MEGEIYYSQFYAEHASIMRWSPMESAVAVKDWEINIEQKPFGISCAAKTHLHTKNLLERCDDKLVHTKIH